MIMVGCGTGVAPFVGFAQERMHLGCSANKCGEAQLFFGARCKEEMLHKGLFEAALDADALTAYNVSMSRELGEQKRYVTDGLGDVADAVWELLQRPDCHYYACGDGRMADSAYHALLAVISQKGKLSRAKATAFMDSMRSQGRYHLDVWGIIKHTQASGKRTIVQNKAQAWLKMIQGAPESEDGPFR
jgi:sulfite reductase alpha subunit-like flavoprotein